MRSEPVSHAAETTKNRREWFKQIKSNQWDISMTEQSETEEDCNKIKVVTSLGLDLVHSASERWWSSKKKKETPPPSPIPPPSSTPSFLHCGHSAALWTGRVKCGKFQVFWGGAVASVYSSISPETLTRSSANESANSLKSGGDRRRRRRRRWWWQWWWGIVWTLTNLIVRMKLSYLILAPTSPMAH